MNGKIDKWGNLCIDRGGVMTVMECRPGGYVPNDRHGHSYESCCHDCPLFGEPEQEKVIVGHRDMPSPFGGEVVKDGPGATINICHGKSLIFVTFTDERGK